MSLANMSDEEFFSKLIGNSTNSKKTDRRFVTTTPTSKEHAAKTSRPSKAYMAAMEHVKKRV